MCLTAAMNRQQICGPQSGRAREPEYLPGVECGPRDGGDTLRDESQPGRSVAPDAVELLEGILMRENAALVGGEWKICYSQQETDAVIRAIPLTNLPFARSGRLNPGTRTRLGSGTGERGTLGPATMWRMDTHIGVPRYPWRFPDGSLVKVIGDSCWWTLVTQHLKKKAVGWPTSSGITTAIRVSRPNSAGPRMRPR